MINALLPCCFHTAHFAGRIGHIARYAPPLSPLRLVTLGLFGCLSLTLLAQPAQRRNTATAAEKTSTTTSSAREFPVAVSMPDNAAWRRDIYRSVDLSKEKNATLYYPPTPIADRSNLFTFLFKLILRGQVKAYEYNLNGTEDFSTSKQEKAKDLMDRYHIYYENNEGRIRLNDADIPSAEVTMYFIKESSFYDQYTATFSRRITAICPVLQREDDFGTIQNQPMFWVKYEDLQPYLAKLSLMGSSLNNAATVTADDYFTLGMYEGDIYMTNNFSGQALMAYCETDTALTAEQARIEQEIATFQEHVWNLDSIAAAEDAEEELANDSTATTKSKSIRRSRRSSSKDSSADSSDSKAAKAATKRNRSSVSTSYSVRRERH